MLSAKEEIRKHCVLMKFLQYKLGRKRLLVSNEKFEQPVEFDVVEVKVICNDLYDAWLWFGILFVLIHILHSFSTLGIELHCPEVKEWSLHSLDNEPLQLQFLGSFWYKHSLEEFEAIVKNYNII
jgi:hypothetical protein